MRLFGIQRVRQFQQQLQAIDFRLKLGDAVVRGVERLIVHGSFTHAASDTLPAALPMYRMRPFLTR